LIDFSFVGMTACCKLSVYPGSSVNVALLFSFWRNTGASLFWF